MPLIPTSCRLSYGAIFLVVTLLSPLGLLAWYLSDKERTPAITVAGGSHSPMSLPPGPPWLLGRADARYTLTLYADLECPFCKAYFPILKSWVDSRPDTVLIWHHLPLSIHEPAATELAVLAECVGGSNGQVGFWNAVTWIYRHTRSDGRGLPAGANYPDATDAIKACTETNRPKSIIRAQVQEAEDGSIDATPTVKLHDNETGKSLLLPGPVDGDALLSALDLIEAGGASASELQEMPADIVGEPR